jgi:alkylation response protein AidB-like acyl-CoA dehydrogenase
MRRLIFEPEHEQFRDTVAKFMSTEVGPNAERWRAQGMVDREIYLKAGANGLLCTWADEKYGGAGIDDFRFEQIIVEENMRHGDVGFYINLHSNLVAPYIAKLGNDEQKDRLMPGIVSGEKILAVAMTEPSTGSDLAGMRTSAVDKGDHWLLNGAKTYISNGIISDVVIVAARTDPNSRHGLSLFIVERGMEGFERGAKLAKMGLHAQDTAELFFNDVKVPEANMLGDPGQGFRYLAQFLAQERLVAAIGFMATAQTAFDLTLEYVMLLNAGELTAEDASAAKLLASELEGRVMDECVQFHGGAGYMSEYRISRMFTDARISRIFAGTSEIMREIIGRSLGLDERKMN